MKNVTKTIAIASVVVATSATAGWGGNNWGGNNNYGPMDGMTNWGPFIRSNGRYD